MFHAHEIKGEFRPLQDWVVLKPEEENPKDRVRGGILLPENVQDYRRCEVVAVGPGYHPNSHGIYSTAFIATELKVGQFVFCPRFVEGELKFRLNGALCFATRERHLNLTIEDVSAPVG
jgi:co-chaperonin GroES (HSP10)